MPNFGVRVDRMALYVFLIEAIDSEQAIRLVKMQCAIQLPDPVEQVVEAEARPYTGPFDSKVHHVRDVEYVPHLLRAAERVGFFLWQVNYALVAHEYHCVTAASTDEACQLALSRS